MAFFTSDDQKRFKHLPCQKICDALIYLLNNIFIRVGTTSKLHRQIVGIPMGTYCASLTAGLIYFPMKKFMMSLSNDTQADIIEAFNSTSRYLDGFLKIDHPYFAGMVSQINTSELQFYKSNTSESEASILDYIYLF